MAEDAVGRFSGFRILRNAWRAHTDTLPRIILSLLSLVFLVRSYRFVYRFRILPPVFDFWTWIDDFQLWDQGRFTFHDLVKVHAGHRLVTTRLVLLADSVFFDMNGWSVLIFNLILLALAGCLLWWLAKPEGEFSQHWEYPPLFWIALLSSTCQVENILMPFQIGHSIFCASVLAATAALVKAISGPDRHRLQLVAWAAFFELIGVYSLGGGVLLAPILLCVLVAFKAPRSFYVIFGFICAVGTGLYFYHIPPAEFRFSPLLDPHLFLKRLNFVTGFIASDLTAFPRLAPFVGISILVTFAGIASVVGHRVYRDRSLFPRDVGLVAIGLFVVACAIAAAATDRLVSALVSGFVSRYATLSLLLWGALLGLFLRWSARRRTAAWVYRFGPIMLAALLLVGLNVRGYGDIAAVLHATATRDVDYVVNNVGVRWSMSISLYDESIDKIRPEISFLHDRKLNMFAPGNGLPMDVLARLHASASEPLPDCGGHIDNATLIDSTGFVTSGWVTNSTAKAGAPWIAAVDERGEVLGVASQTVVRGDVENHLGLRAAHGFDTGFRFHEATDDLAPRTFQLLGLFPGDREEICRLPNIGRLSAARITTLDALRDPKPVLLGPASGLERLDFRPGAMADPGINLPSGLPTWQFVAGAGADANIQFSLAQPLEAGRALAIPFAMVDSWGEDSVTFKMADGSSVDAKLLPLWDVAVWRAAVLNSDVMARHGGVSAIEISAQGGKWFAFGVPIAVTLKPDWARLF